MQEDEAEKNQKAFDRGPLWKNLDDGKSPAQTNKEWEDFKTKLLHAVIKRNKDQVSELLALHAEKAYHIKTVRDGEDSTPLVYKDGWYQPDYFTVIDETIRSLIGPAHSPQVFNAVIAKVKADTYVDESEFMDERIPFYLPCKNRIVNLLSKEAMLFEPKLMFRHQLPVTFDRSSKCPLFLEFINEIISKDDIPVVQEFFGFCLYRGYPYQKALMLLGAGNNGKSTLLRIIRSVIGQENTICLGLQAISDPNNFEGSELKGKYLNLVGESGGRFIGDVSGFKEVTGNEAVTRKRKNLRTITFVPFAKHVFSFNELPRFGDQSDGNFRRWILVELPHGFVTRKEYDLLKDKTGVKVAEPEKIDLIINNEEEKSGILNWMIEGLTRLLEQNGFSYNKTTAQTRDLIVRKGDPFGSFVDDRIKEEDGGRVLKSKLEDAFSDWCKHEGIGSKFNHRKMRNTILSRFPGVEDKVVREVEFVGKAYCNISMSDCNSCNQSNLVSKTDKKNNFLEQYQNTVTGVTSVTNEVSDSSVSEILKWVVSQGNEVPLDAFLERFGAETFARLKSSGDVAEHRANRVSAVFPGDYT